MRMLMKCVIFKLQHIKLLSSSKSAAELKKTFNILFVYNDVVAVRCLLL